MNTVTTPHLDHRHDFAQDVLHGLRQQQKSLPCKWFYDQRGSMLFDEITRTPEYYPTRVEKRLLAEIAEEIPSHVPALKVMIEPGSGTSEKTRVLLETQPTLETYIPIDISSEFLFDMAQNLQHDFPQLAIRPIVGDFSAPLEAIDLDHAHRRMVFFPGSTIGNFEPEQARELLENFHTLSAETGWLLIGVDTTQDPQLLTAAYNDQAGVTARFNRNLLLRANRELRADFDVAQFAHHAHFNEALGRVEMHLVSRCAQQVAIAGEVFEFDADETIHTENCYKYQPAILDDLAAHAGWQRMHAWQDSGATGFTLFLYQSVNQA